MNNNQVAICIFGNNDNLNTIKDQITSKFVTSKLDFFNVPDASLYKSLWLTANQKRQQELLRKKDYDICIGVNAQDHAILSVMGNPSFIDSNTLYFTEGEHIRRFNQTKVTISVFYSSSWVFDRVSEFMFTDVPPSYKRLNTDEENFYFHLKYLKIKTQCTNYENCNLFKRTT